VPPSGVVYSRSAFRRRVNVLPPFDTSSTSVPCISPSQLRYNCTLSSASTAATESSQSMIVLTAASSTTSFTFATSARPIGVEPSIWISRWSPLCFSRIAAGASAAP